MYSWERTINGLFSFFPASHRMDEDIHRHPKSESLIIACLHFLLFGFSVLKFGFVASGFFMGHSLQILLHNGKENNRSHKVQLLIGTIGSFFDHEFPF